MQGEDSRLPAYYSARCCMPSFSTARRVLVPVHNYLGFHTDVWELIEWSASVKTTNTSRVRFPDSSPLWTDRPTINRSVSVVYVHNWNKRIRFSVHNPTCSTEAGGEKAFCPTLSIAYRHVLNYVVLWVFVKFTNVTNSSRQICRQTMSSMASLPANT